MKKPAFCLSFICIILIFSNIGMIAQSNVGIGTINPSFLLDYEGKLAHYQELDLR